MVPLQAILPLPTVHPLAPTLLAHTVLLLCRLLLMVVPHLHILLIHQVSTHLRLMAPLHMELPIHHKHHMDMERIHLLHPLTTRLILLVMLPTEHRLMQVMEQPQQQNPVLFLV